MGLDSRLRSFSTFSLIEENSPTEESRKLNGSSNKSECYFKDAIRRFGLLWEPQPQQLSNNLPVGRGSEPPSHLITHGLQEKTT